MNSDMMTAATAGTEVFRCALARRRNANPPHLVLAPTFAAAAAAAGGAANSSGEEAPRGERKHLFNPFGCMLGRSYFRRCREEMNEGYFAKVPTGYFPVAPSEVPCRVPVEGVVAGEVLSYSALPLPKIEKRFYKQLNDGTFVRLPFLYPEVYYEGEEEPADERYYIRADAADASSADPSTLPEEAFAKVPPAIAEEITNWQGPKRIPIPSERYVMKLGFEYQLHVTEDAFQEVNTSFMRLDLQSSPDPHPRGARQPRSRAHVSAENPEDTPVAV
ncbi:virion protein V67 [Equid alphaherpesvirus 1]|uniref:Virion protein V67 n=3 Tax=Equid alphaherpesvirus 1 TaxID=10326 RepID=A0A076JXQ4_9ALPH|nr:virion protein V67 [Equid alphaherpesvirus 1]AII81250.1 virion protein V67 [Equid alphaherpesvirus 1]AII81320.1 virion protein V67 [Equid alphaherpesvirus 1]AII81330.1 virion protein V67 [Equid alphaherpesvirus 1]AII81400.1 virion protein V67 [Equid alphaherpesvirus 1]